MHTEAQINSALKRIELGEKETDISYGSNEWFKLPFKEQFKGEKLKRVETHQRDVFMKIYKFKSKQEQLDEFAMFFTELYDGKIKSMFEYAKKNKIVRKKPVSFRNRLI